MGDHAILIADIGGTNARFALATSKEDAFSGAQTYSAAEFEQLYDAIDQYLAAQHIEQLHGIVLAIAGPIADEKVSLLNSYWSADCAELRQRYQVDNTQLLNDWEAIAYSLDKLSDTDLIAIGGKWARQQKDKQTFGALGPGSGLGVTGLIRNHNTMAPIISEGGHAGFAPQSDLQIKILSYLYDKYQDRISIERLLSGPGLVNIHEAFCHINGVENPGLSAADISQAAVDKSDKLCQASLDLFFEILGQTAGDVSLNYGAYDGIFIAGGICQRYPEKLATSQFRQGFENKGRHHQHMKAVPTWLITHKNPGLLGASVYAQRWL